MSIDFSQTNCTYIQKVKDFALGDIVGMNEVKSFNQGPLCVTVSSGNLIGKELQNA